MKGGRSSKYFIYLHENGTMKLAEIVLNRIGGKGEQWRE
jgi:hypothetical protein